MNIFYTYAWLREDGTPYYIGKGKGDRAWKKRGRGVNPPSDKSKILILKTNLPESEAFRHEIYMIAVFGRKDVGTGILYNFTDGGEGCSGMIHTEEAKRRVSEANSNPSEETRRKKSESGKVKIFSEEHRRKLSEAGKNRVLSEESRKKISEKRKGIKFSVEHRRRLSEAAKGKTMSDEARKRVSEVHTGKKTSEETRRKQSEAMKRYHEMKRGAKNEFH